AGDGAQRVEGVTRQGARRAARSPAADRDVIRDRRTFDRGGSEHAPGESGDDPVAFASGAADPAGVVEGMGRMKWLLGEPSRDPELAAALRRADPKPDALRADDLRRSIMARARARLTARPLPGGHWWDW